MEVIVLFQPWNSFEGKAYYRWRAIDPHEHTTIYKGHYHTNLDEMRVEIQTWAEDGGFAVMDRQPQTRIQQLPTYSINPPAAAKQSRKKKKAGIR